MNRVGNPTHVHTHAHHSIHCAVSVPLKHLDKWVYIYTPWMCSITPLCVPFSVVLTTCILLQPHVLLLCDKSVAFFSSRVIKNCESRGILFQRRLRSFNLLHVKLFALRQCKIHTFVLTPKMNLRVL